MSNTAFKTHIILNNKTSSEWAASPNNTTIPLKGEVCIYSDLRKLKIGDGLTLIGDLPFANLTTDDITNLPSINSREYSTLVPRDGTEIPENADLNTITYIKVGKYFCSKDTTVATLSNCPTVSGFMMEVISPLSDIFDNESTDTWIYRVRKITDYGGNIYIQSVSSSSVAGNFTYGDWKSGVPENVTVANAVHANTADSATNATNATNATTAANALKLGGYPVAANVSGKGNTFGYIPVVDPSAGLMEIGRYLDFHYSSGETDVDYKNRVFLHSDNRIYFSHGIGNLGWVHIYSGSTTGAVTLSSDYDFYLVCGWPADGSASGAAHSTVIVPSNATGKYFQFSDESYYYKFQRTSTGISARSAGTGTVREIYGLTVP